MSEESEVADTWVTLQEKFISAGDIRSWCMNRKFSIKGCQYNTFSKQYNQKKVKHWQHNLILHISASRMMSLLGGTAKIYS